MAGRHHFRERTKKAERESREQSRPRPGAARRPNGRRPHAAGDGTAGRREREHQGRKEPPTEKGTATPPAGHTSTQGQRPTRQAAASVHFPRPRRGRGTKGEGAKGLPLGVGTAQITGTATKERKTQPAAPGYGRGGGGGGAGGGKGAGRAVERARRGRRGKPGAASADHGQTRRPPRDPTARHATPPPAPPPTGRERREKTGTATKKGNSAPGEK